MADDKPRDLSHVPEALRPTLFKPGQSGNPGGRPKGRTFAGEVEKILAKRAYPGVPGDGTTKKERMAEIMVETILERKRGWTRLLVEYLRRAWPTEVNFNLNAPPPDDADDAVMEALSQLRPVELRYAAKIRERVDEAARDIAHLRVVHDEAADAEVVEPADDEDEEDETQ